jgi:hypothetical protein
MSRESIGVVRALVLGLAVLLVAPAARAEDNSGNHTGVINCGDENTRKVCHECCSGPCSTITCCPLSGPCDVINKPSGGSPPLKLKLVAGGWNVQLQRVIKPDYVDVKLKASFLKKIFPKGMNVKVRLTGPDAELGGLVYPVAFTGQGTNTPTALANAGVNVTIEGTPTTCQSFFPAQACTDMAVGLARQIQGALGVASREDLDAFVDAVSNMGYGPCGIIF